jgi:hypothetical protein
MGWGLVVRGYRGSLEATRGGKGWLGEGSAHLFRVGGGGGDWRMDTVTRIGSLVGAVGDKHAGGVGVQRFELFGWH